MDYSNYGPFANIVAIALALTATFSVLLINMIGRVKQWTWLSYDSPNLLVTVGARIVAVALMAVTYITINKSNYLVFGVLAIISGCVGLYFIIRFNHLRNLHIVKKPVVGPNGQQQVGPNNKPAYTNLLIGSEKNINAIAQTHFDQARLSNPGLSLINFMDGYGTPPNNPEAIWSREELAKLSNKLMMSLILIALCGITVLFWAAFIIEVFNRK